MRAHRHGRWLDAMGLWLLVAWPALCVLIAFAVYAYGG